MLTHQAVTSGKIRIAAGSGVDEMVGRRLVALFPAIDLHGSFRGGGSQAVATPSLAAGGDLRAGAAAMRSKLDRLGFGEPGRGGTCPEKVQALLSHLGPGGEGK